MFTLLVFLAVLGVLVLSHEWGHFVVARRSGIKVSEFGFGFPPRLFGVRYHKDAIKKWEIVWGRRKKIEDDENSPTLYTFNLIPLGGFVRIKGEDANALGAGDTDSFTVKKVWQKAAVLLAGVFMNVLVAVILLSVTFAVGFPVMVAPDAVVSGVTELRVMEVLPGKPAEAAGILAGDIILQTNDLKSPRLTVLQDHINAHKLEEVTIVLKRRGEVITKKIRPTTYEDTGRGAIGVSIAEVAFNRYALPQAVYHGILTTAEYTQQIVSAFWYLLKDLVTGHGMSSAVSGPVGVAVATGEVARMGWVYLFQFTALLSLNLAVLNVLPIPALDGGRLLFIIIGAIRRRPIAPYVEQMCHAISFVLLMFLVVVVTVKDINNFTGFFSTVWHNIF